MTEALNNSLLRWFEKTPGDVKAEKLYEKLSAMKTGRLVDALDDTVAKDKPRDTW